MQKEDINPLCRECKNKCKQPASAKIIKCPLFKQKRKYTKKNT